MEAFSSKVVVANKWLAGAVYIFAGLVLLVLGLPLAALPFIWEGFARWVPWLLMALPVWVGIASAPGCLMAVLLVARGRPGGARWVRFSLWGGLMATTAGTAGGSLMALFVPFGLVGLLGSIVLLYVISDFRVHPRPVIHRWAAKVFVVVVVVFAGTLWALQASPRAD